MATVRVSRTLRKQKKRTAARIEREKEVVLRAIAHYNALYALRQAQTEVESVPSAQDKSER